MYARKKAILAEIKNLFHTTPKSGDAVRLDNSKTVLGVTDQLLKQKSAPALEVLYVNSYVTWKLPLVNWGVCTNMYGHSAIRFTLDSNSYVMNIEGRGRDSIINFYRAEDFLFSNFSEQGGVFEREIFGSRHYNVPEEVVMDIVEFYLGAYKNKVKFHMYLFPLFNFLSNFINLKERGNCSRWSSKAFKDAGFFPIYTMWPKRLLITSFEHGGEMVQYKHKEQTIKPVSFAMPFHWLMSWLYSDLSLYSSVVVDYQGNKAVAKRNLTPLKPSWFRSWVNHPIVTILTIGLVGYGMYYLFGKVTLPTGSLTRLLSQLGLVG